MEEGATEKERRSPDWARFSLATILKQCKLGAAANPGWPTKLNMPNLRLFLKNQDCDHWWLPGVKTIQDYDEEDEDEDEDEDEEPGA
jgi:hypothetical protein